jgi:hypothetical protein
MESTCKDAAMARLNQYNNIFVQKQAFSKNICDFIIDVQTFSEIQRRHKDN